MNQQNSLKLLFIINPSSSSSSSTGVSNSIFSGLTITGDLLGQTSGGTLLISQLKNVITAGSVGSNTQIPVLTYDSKGRLTLVSSVTIATSAGSSGITSINNQVNSFQTLITGLTGLDFQILSSGGVHQFNIPTAGSGTTRGLLSSTDWNKFNTIINDSATTSNQQTWSINAIKNYILSNPDFNVSRGQITANPVLDWSAYDIQVLNLTQNLTISGITNNSLGKIILEVNGNYNLSFSPSSNIQVFGYQVTGLTNYLTINCFNTSGNTFVAEYINQHFSGSTVGGSSSGLTSINNITQSLQQLTTGNTGLDFQIISSGSTHEFRIPTASSGVTRGLLSTTDWIIFNSKQSLIGYSPLSGNTVQPGMYNTVLVDSKGLVVSGSNIQYLTSFTQSLQSSIFSGDAYGSGTTAVTLTLNTITIATTVGSGNQIPVITYDNKGRIISSTTATIVTGVTSINNISLTNQYLTTGNTGLDFQIVSSGNTHQFNIPTAYSSITRGLLSSSDWLVFNSKQNVIGYIPYNSTNPNNYISGNTVQPGTYNNVLVDSKGLIVSGINIQYLTSFTQTLQNNIFSGDLYGSGTTGVTLTLNSIITPGSVGSSTQIPVLTYDNKGRLITVSSVTIATSAGSSGITTINNQTNAFQTLITGSTGLDFQILSSGGAHQFNIPTANSGVTRGLLSATDWLLFNSKQTVLNGIGFIKASGSTITYDNSVYLSGSGTANRVPYYSTTNAFTNAANLTFDGTKLKVGTGTSSFPGTTLEIIANNTGTNVPFSVENSSTTGKNVAFFAGAKGDATTFYNNTNIGILQKDTTIGNYALNIFYNSAGFDTAYLGVKYNYHGSTLGSLSGDLFFATAGGALPDIKLQIMSTGVVNIKNLIGPGTRIVNVDSSGNLSSTTIVDVTQGGTGLSTLGIANQLLRVNSSTTGLEFFTLTYLTGLTSVNNLTLGNQFLTTGNTGLDFQIISSGNTHQFKIPTAYSSVTRGLLSGTDWSVFNAKQNTLNYIPLSGNTVQSGTYNTVLVDSKGLVVSGSNVQYLTSFTETLQSSIFLGDVYGSGTTAVTLTLNTITSGQTVGSSSQIPVITYDNKGRIINTTTAPINIPKNYFQSGITFISSSAITITHNLNLTNKDTFIFRIAESDGTYTPLIDNKSINNNSCSFTSQQTISGMCVTIIGF